MGKNMKELFESLGIKRTQKYLTVTKDWESMRVRVPGTEPKTFSKKKCRGIKSMVTKALLYRDSQLKNMKASPVLYKLPIKLLDNKHSIKQSSRALYSAENTDDIKSIIIKGYIDGNELLYEVPLNKFKKGAVSEYYHAHYYAVYIRNQAFYKNIPPTKSMEKAAFHWAMNADKHQYQKMDEETLDKTIKQYKGIK